MSAHLTEAQVAKLFEQVNRSPINEGLKELRKVMQPAQTTVTNRDNRVIHRVVLTNGTGKTERTGEYVELERGSY